MWEIPNGGVLYTSQKLLGGAEILYSKFFYTLCMLSLKGIADFNDTIPNDFTVEVQKYTL